MIDTLRARFDLLLTAMINGGAPSARKKPSAGQASGAETSEGCSETQIQQDILEDASHSRECGPVDGAF